MRSKFGKNKQIVNNDLLVFNKRQRDNSIPIKIFPPIFYLF